MHWVLVTGAGASRTLGRGGEQLPLMTDWATDLIGELEQRERGLAGAIGLSEGMAAVEFEATIGALLRWRDLRPLNERFQALGGQSPGHVSEPVIEARRIEGDRVEVVLDAINTTLFRLFSANSIDEARAVSAFGDLLNRLGNPDRLTIVTTNYDPSAEIALDALGRSVETGFIRKPGRAPALSPRGLVDLSRKAGSLVPVLHLHGAVGWYERDGNVYEQHQDQPFNATLGRPVVLYPDPDKDPMADAIVQSLWEEFDDALSDADAILVLGHSLNDPALVTKLQGATARAHLGVTTFVPAERPTSVDSRLVPDQAEVDRLLALFPSNSNILPLRFGPPEEAHVRDLGIWLGGLRERQD